VPTLYLTTDRSAANIRSFVESGGQALVTYWSGIVDESDHVRLGGYPGAFRELLGISTEEFYPLRDGEMVHLAGGPLEGAVAEVWTELLTLRGAKEVSGYVDGPLPGVPTLTRHGVGEGTAWYLATRPRADGVAALVRELCAAAGVEVHDPDGVEVVRRHGSDATYLFVLNHTGENARIPATGTDLVSGRECAGTVDVPAGSVAVVREEVA